MKEKAFLKFQRDRYMKMRLRNDFKTARNIFEKQLRSSEREYRRSLAINVVQVSTENPKAFWDHIKQLGPKRKGSIPMEVYRDDENIISDENFVFQKWSSDFKNLNNAEPYENFDDRFYHEILSEKTFLEDGMLDPLSEQNPILNVSISHCEVKKGVNCAKKR